MAEVQSQVKPTNFIQNLPLSNTIKEKKGPLFTMGNRI